MSKFWQGLMAVHDTSAFGHMSHHILGVPYYSDRALLLPATAAVVHEDGEDLEAYLSYLQRVRIGPQRVIRVGGPTLFDGLENDHFAMEALRAHFRAGGLLQVFCPSERSDAFLARHMIEAKRLHSAPRAIADRLNDKAELRRIVVDCGLAHAILPYVATRDPQEVMSAVRRFRAMRPDACEFPVIKPTNRAGGDGFMAVRAEWPDDEVVERVREYLRANSWNQLAVTVHSELRRSEGKPVVLDRADVRDIGRDVDDGIERVRALVEKLFESEKEADHAIISRVNAVGGASIRIARGFPLGEPLRRFLLDQCRNELIVEAGFGHDAFSTQIVVDHGHYRFLGPTKQIVDDEGRHMGNIMVRFFDDSLSAKGLTGEDRHWMESYSLDVAKYAHSRVEGYKGTIGFDFLKRKRDGRIFLLECNARQTAATYPLAVSAQLEGRVREPLNLPKSERMNWGVVMHNAVPTRARSWGALSERLGGLLFDGTWGALPFNIRLMRLETPHVGIVATGETVDRALAVMRLARRKLSN